MKRKRVNYRLLTTIFACISAFLLGLIISKAKVNATVSGYTYEKVIDLPFYSDKAIGLGEKFMWQWNSKLYLSYKNEHYEYDDVNNTWLTKTWYGLDDLTAGFYARYLWYNGNTLYYSAGGKQYVLNDATSTWSVKTWNINNPYGQYIWHYGNDVYYSNGSISSNTTQYILNQSTGDFDVVTWTCSTYSSYPFKGDNIYVANNNYYVSVGSNTGSNVGQFLINPSNHTLTLVDLDYNTPSGFFTFQYGIKTYYARLENYSSTQGTATYGALEFDNTNNVWVTSNFPVHFSNGSSYFVYKNSLYYYNEYGMYKYMHNSSTSLYQEGYQYGYGYGMAEVLFNPTNYDLYNQTQYDAHYQEGVNDGKIAVELDPHTYNLYNSYDMTTNYNSGVTAGENNVTSNPNNYNLYSQAQYNSSYNSGVTAGENNVTSNPNSYNLYSQAQYNSSYNSGVTAGENNVTSNPNNYNLYTQVQYTNYGTTRYNDGVSVGESNVTTNPSNYDLYTESEYEQYGEDEYEDGYEEAYAKLLTYTGTLSLDYAHIEYGNDGTQYNVSNVSDGNTITLMNMYTADDFNTNQTDYLFKLNKYISLDSNLIFNFSGVVNSELNNSTYVDFYKDNLSNSIFRVSYAELINYNGDLKRLVEDRYLTYPIFNYIKLSIDTDSSTGLALMRSNTSLTSINVANATINYNVGYNEGYEIGYTEGSNTTNETSYNLGYNAGYSYATENASENSLVGVVGAVATTPVTILTSIFNFEFLGINIAGFILSIITLFVVIWLIKRFI
jgi:hypothetical protein